MVERSLSLIDSARYVEYDTIYMELTATSLYARRAQNQHALYHPRPVQAAPEAWVKGGLYCAGMLLAMPFIGLHSLFRPRRYWTRFLHRFGFFPRQARMEVTRHLLLHCHNIGELRTAIPFVRLLKKRHPEWSISMFSKAFEPFETVQQLLPEVSQAFFAPLDGPLFTWRALRRLRPDAVVTVENDLRTYLVTEAKRQGIATLYLGGELSPRERKRHPSRDLYRNLLNNTDVIAMRSEEDARELAAIGATEERLFVCGNLRFDLDTFSLEIADPVLRNYLDLWRNTGPLLVAGSTYLEEEAGLLDMFRRIRNEYPTFRMVIAPRRPNRADEVMHAASEQGYTPQLRSRLHDHQVADADLLVLDTMGELTPVYSAADLAFVGGSIVDRGGHNIIEAAVHGIPVLFGEHVYTNREISEALLQHGAACTVTGTDDLTAHTLAYLRQPELRRAAGQRAREAVTALGGATENCVRLLEEVMAQRDANR